MFLSTRSWDISNRRSPRPPPWSWRLSLAPEFGKWFSRVQAFLTWQTRQIHSPGTGLGGGWRQGWGLVWLILPTTISFMMISRNLHAIWPFLFLNLSQDLIVVLLMYFGTLGDGSLLQGSNKKPSRHKHARGKRKSGYHTLVRHTSKKTVSWLFRKVYTYTLSTLCRQRKSDLFTPRKETAQP